MFEEAKVEGKEGSKKPSAYTAPKPRSPAEYRRASLSPNSCPMKFSRYLYLVVSFFHHVKKVLTGSKPNLTDSCPFSFVSFPPAEGAFAQHKKRREVLSRLMTSLITLDFEGDIGLAKKSRSWLK